MPKWDFATVDQLLADPKIRAALPESAGKVAAPFEDTIKQLDASQGRQGPDHARGGQAAEVGQRALGSATGSRASSITPRRTSSGGCSTARTRCARTCSTSARGRVDGEAGTYRHRRRRPDGPGPWASSKRSATAPCGSAARRRSSRRGSSSRRPRRSRSPPGSSTSGSTSRRTWPRHTRGCGRSTRAASCSASASAIQRRRAATRARCRRCAVLRRPPPLPREERSPRRSGRRCSTWRSSARSARTPTSRRRSTRGSPASGSGRTRDRARARGRGRGGPRDGAGDRAPLRRAVPAADQLHVESAALRLQRRRHRATAAPTA